MRHVRIDPPASHGAESDPWAKRSRVEDWMSQPVVTVSARASREEALRSMVDHRIHYLPVVDDEAHLVGMVNEDGARSPRIPMNRP